MNHLPAQTPSSISRRRTGLYFSPDLESVLGKRKSEHPPPGAKRNTTFQFEEERSIQDLYNAPRPGSSTSDVDEHERLEHDRRADVSRGSFHPRPIYPLHGSRRFFHQLERINLLRSELLTCPELQILFHPNRRLI